MQTSKQNCECGTPPITVDGETICPTCGIVHNEPMINYGQDHRAFTLRERETRGRTGSPLSPAVHDTGLTTMIGRVGRDAFGKKLKQDDKLRMLRMKKWQIRSGVHSSKDRNLAQAMGELDRLCDKISISQPVKERAAVIYRKALDAGLVRGRSISAIVAASLYAAIRMEGIPRTLKQVEAVSPNKKKEVARCFRLLLKTLGLKMPKHDAKLKIPGIANKLNLSMKTQNRAVEIIRAAEKVRHTAGKDPMGLAAASLYIALRMDNPGKGRKGMGITQKMLADAANITEVTIRNRYRGLRVFAALRICKSCGKLALNKSELSQFVRHRGYKFDHENWCLDCRREYNSNWMREKRAQ